MILCIFYLKIHLEPLSFLQKQNNEQTSITKERDYAKTNLPQNTPRFCPLGQA